MSTPIATATSWARTDGYAARLNAGGTAPQPLGPLTQFAVQQGDTLRVTAPGLYPQATSNNSFAFSLASFVAALLNPAPGAPAGADGTRRGGLPLLQIGLNAAVLNALVQVPGGVPKGYLRVLSFNQDSVLVDQRTVQLSAAARGNYETLSTGPLLVQQNGYVSVYVGNESNADVYFDDVTIEHRQGLQVQETEYDPTGLELAGLTRDTPGLKPLNQYRWNGKEFQPDLGLNWTQLDWRMVDQQLDWFPGVDPEVENGQESMSPYVFGYDNAVRFNDPNGRNPGDGDGLLGRVVDFVSGAANAWASNESTLPVPGGGQASLVQRWQGNADVSAGQTLGDAFSLVKGGVDFLVGGATAVTGAVGGVVTSETGVGAVVGYGVALGGAAVAGHGLNTMNNGMKNLLNDDHNGRYNASSKTSGESSGTANGRQQHKAYSPGKDYTTDPGTNRLQNGKIPDGINHKARIVSELKPNNPRAIKRGEKQVEGYRQQLEKETGKKWTSRVDTY